MRRQHDDDGIGAGKMFGVATGTDAFVARIRHGRRVAAAGAEAVALVPVDQRLGLAEDRGVLQRQLHRGRAHVAEMAEARKRTLIGGIARRRNVEREIGRVALEAEQDRNRIRSGNLFRQTRPQESRLRARRAHFPVPG